MLLMVDSIIWLIKGNKHGHSALNKPFEVERNGEVFLFGYAHIIHSYCRTAVLSWTADQQQS